MARKRKVTAESVQPVGMFRVQLTQDGRVVGDSGWRKNQITNYGAQYYIVENLYGSASSKRVTHMAIGTGTAPDATSTSASLNGELGSRVTVSFSIVASRTAQFTAQFASSVFSVQGAKTIQNLGLACTSDSATQQLFAGQTYTTSQWQTNQDVNATYQVRFP